MERIIEEKDRLVEELESVIDVEHSSSVCFQHLASLIKNGRIRSKFSHFAYAAKVNKDLLTDCLSKFGVTDFKLEEKCIYCKIKPENFSLTGAIELGLEVSNIAIKRYKILLKLSAPDGDGRLFKKLRKEKIRQKALLIKEKKYHRDEEAGFKLIRDYCLPLVRSIP